MNSRIECVPNVSEGENRQLLDALAESVAGVSGVDLLCRDESPHVRRSVFTFTGPAQGVAEAALRFARVAVAGIDLSTYQSVHPHVGALDVCPFVPLGETPMADCVALARDVGQALAEEHRLPVYLYERAAGSEKRRRLADIRRNWVGALPHAGVDGSEEEGNEVARAHRAEVIELLPPDFGPLRPHPTAGACVVGARDLLIAYNVSIDTADSGPARRIAAALRELGPRREGSARLTGLRAIGWSAPGMQHAQVSCNITDPVAAPLHQVFSSCVREAELLGHRVTGSEIIGLVPLESLLAAGHAAARAEKNSTVAGELPLIELAVRTLKLDKSNFDPARRILDADRGALWQPA